MEQLFSDGALTVPFGADFFSVAVGVITGAMFACDRKLDIVGTIVLGLMTAYGGGIIRDLLLQDDGVYFMEHPSVILICIGLAVFVFYFRGLFRHSGQLLFFADALSVALFALAGANKAFACGEGLVMVVILGALTSVGGGALRDISVYYDWKTADEADLTPKVSRGAHAAKDFCAEMFRRATLHRKRDSVARAPFFRKRKD